MNKDIWPPKPLTPSPTSEATKLPPTNHEFLLIPGAVIGAILYVATLYVGWPFVISFGHHFILGRQYIYCIIIITSVILANCTTGLVYFLLQRKLFYMAWGFLSGSLFMTALVLFYTVRVWFFPGPHRLFL